MRPLVLADVLNLYEYEKVRDRLRQRIIEIKKHRRVHLGDRISLVFENRDTVLFQVQEMVRAERIVKDNLVQEELDVYNELIPGAGELSATLFIEITDSKDIQSILDSFQGIDRGGTLFLKIGDDYAVPAVFEQGRSKEDKISAVHFIRFKLTPEQKAALLDKKNAIELVVNHSAYQAKAKVSPELRAELVEDLR